MPFVLDNSVTIAWAFQDEQTPYAVSVLERLELEPAFVPVIWSLEVANVLLVGERRGRIAVSETAAFLEQIDALPIVIDDAPWAGTKNTVLTLARSQRLSAYDASYLELAVRRGLSLATLDKRLRAAASQLGVPLVEPTPA